MSDLLKLTKIEFDGMENNLNDAMFVEEEKYFTSDEIANAHAKCYNYLATLTVKPYLGWDGEVYPKFIVKRINAE